MGKIYYITGPSSCGKDTIYKEIVERQCIPLRTIVMYTTRPIRDGEGQGVEYHFVSVDELSRLTQEGRVIEQRSYQTMHGLWSYFTVFDEQIDLDKYTYLMIGTVESYVKTRDYFGADKVIPILLQVDDGVRLQRAIDRERQQDSPRYQELCRRYLADALDFSEEKIQAAEIMRSFSNENKEQCLNEVEAFLKQSQ